MFTGRSKTRLAPRPPLPPPMPPAPLAPPPPIAPVPRFEREVGQLDRAVNDLRRRAPDLSAATPMPLWQQLAVLAATSMLTAGLFVLDGPGLYVWSLALALPFLTIALIRVTAVFHVIFGRMRRRRTKATDRRFDGWLPTYSVLIPLYREAAVAPALVRAMARLDYPGDRLEILFVTEADDQATRRALLQSGLAATMRIVAVPKGQPRTKPRALNYALQDARGMLVAVFDAEDVPEPAQLRRAAQAFIEGGPKLACVQARLGIYNADETFLSRQFALEYAALFGGLLPALAFLRLPMPLGGTSNHFRRDLLSKSGGWDPFNVTEDADLGIRLARLGYEVSVIDSETQEEAPAAWKTWVGQRTRWIKGWLQTYLVHMRRPLRLWRDLGAWGFLGFQVMIGGMTLSILVHPWFYILAGVHGLLDLPFTPDNRLLWWVCGTNFAAGYSAAWLLIIATAIRSGAPGRLLSVVWLPLYWLAISFAAYRALLDFIVRPFYWEKTAHKGRGRKRREATHVQAGRD